MDNNKIINGSSAQIIELNPELRNIGYADGININGALNDEEKLEMIDKAAVKFGEFLDALGCDWKNDPNSMETPKRVAKAYVNDWAAAITSDVFAEENESYLLEKSDLIRTEGFDENLRLYVEEGNNWIKRKYGFNSHWQMQQYTKFFYDQFFVFHPELIQYKI